MEYVLLGNGFDIHHELPTRYIDVLNFFDFWIKSIDQEYSTLEQLVKAYLSTSSSSDSSSKEAFNKYYRRYCNMLKLVYYDKETANKMLKPLEKNCWYRYFTIAFHDNVNWVDFEQEIRKVLLLFQRIYRENPVMTISKRHIEAEYIYKDTFFDIFNSFFVKPSNTIEYWYVGEYQRASSINKDIAINFSKMLDDLYKELKRFNEVFQYYLKLLVNSVVSPVQKSKALSFLTTSQYVITLNYTNTYEQLYGGIETINRIVHYHGSANDENIVLGLNATEEDEYVEGRAPSTDFIKFKKYYQRMVNESDSDYIKHLQDIQYLDKKYAASNFYVSSSEKNSLVVIGHSLDVTDAEIIRDLFEVCRDSITIYYHNDEARTSYLENLIRIFGKSNLEEMRRTRKFKLVKLQEYQPVNENCFE